MTMRELVLKNRSYRRFHQEVSVEYETLRGLVNLARLSASAGNHQPLKYILSCNPEKNAVIFPQLGWATYLKDWPGPPEGERPSAYIIVLGDKTIRESFSWDHRRFQFLLRKTLIFEHLLLHKNARMVR